METTSIFENTKQAFVLKSNQELSKAIFLFRIFNQAWMVKIGSSFTELALQMGLPIEGLVRSIIYDHFCGGENVNKINTVLDKLERENVGVLLNYGVEAKRTEKDYAFSIAENKAAITKASADKRIKAVCIKISGFGRFELFEKKQLKSHLSQEETKEWESISERFFDLCAYAAKNHVSIYFDAEESWIQEPMDELITEAMKLYNKNEAIVFQTYQLYRSDKLAHLVSDINLAKNENFVLGAKLVRGAYVEKETEHYKSKTVASPVHINKENTDKDYDQGLILCLENIQHVSFCVASHNESSCKLLVDELQRRNIPFNHKHISVSQLYGMGDHLTFNLASLGIPCTKYLPYGPVKEVIPYLIRRAQENSSVGGQMSRELKLLLKEAERRKI